MTIMASRNSNALKVTAANQGSVAATAAVAPQMSEADFKDTIANNRGLALMDLTTVPHLPDAFRPTDQAERSRRIRWLSMELKAEAIAALNEAGKRDLKAELGPFAPDPQRAVTIGDRVAHSAEILARAEDLLGYAKEVHQIAMSDALNFLEAEQKQYLNAVEHKNGLAAHYRALVKLFEMRSGAIADGIAQSQAKSKEASAPAADPVEKGAGK
jgi:hypothetical protein